MSVLRDKVFTVPEAGRMLDMLSPIYDDSYVVIWIMEVIAREYHSAHKILDTFPDQFMPETATWAIELWEDRYGVESDASATLRERRNAVSAKRTARYANNTERFRQVIRKISGVDVRIDEHADEYTFAVYLQSPSSVSEGAIREYIERIKPAHLSYFLLYEMYTQSTQYHAGVISWYGRVEIKQAY